VAPAPSKPRWIDVAAIVLLLIGGLIVPLVGWLVGVVLLWVSNAWNVRDKVIGTVFVPGGLGLAGFVILLAGATSGSSSGSESAGSSDLVDALVMSLFLAIIVAPIITTAYLTYRLIRRPAAAMA
jgi:hypothetical protein